MSPEQQLMTADAKTLDISQPMLFCPRCHVQIRETDNYCYNCGKSLKRGYGFLYTHTGIILMALVIGPFALPFALLSKRIGPIAKVIYTLLLLALGYFFVIMCVQAYSSVQQTLNSMTNLQNFSNMQGFSTIDLKSF